MDKLKVAGAILKKYNFWFLSLTVMLAGLITWLIATSGLTSEFEQFSSDVSRRVSEQQAIVQQNPAHPNDDVNAGYKQLNDQLRMKVLNVWRQLYERQRAEVLQWPPELRRDFLQYIQSRKFGDPIPIEFRERYQNYVRERFGELSEIVQARKVELSNQGLGMSEGGMGGPGMGRMGSRSRTMRMPGEMRSEDGSLIMPEEDPYLVEWEVANQETLQAKLLWTEPPSSLKMWVTQEDLWVYEALLNIIARTNDGATGPHNAKVTVIEALEVGSDAAPGSQTQGRIVMLQPADSMGMMGEGGFGEGMGMESGMMGEGMGMGMDPMGGMEGMGQTLDPAMLDRLLLMRRYLDAEGKVMEVSEEGLDLSEEYKRVPVRLVLQMDPREIPRLVVECANATLPVEVQQVRVNVDPNATGRGRSGGGSEMGMPSPRMSMPRRGGDMMGPGGEGTGLESRHIAQVRVVVQGIIYIFNPPHLEKLGIDPRSLPRAVRQSTTTTPAAASGIGAAPGAAAAEADAAAPAAPGAGDVAPAPADEDEDDIEPAEDAAMLDNAALEDDAAVEENAAVEAGNQAEAGNPAAPVVE